MPNATYPDDLMDAPFFRSDNAIRAAYVAEETTITIPGGQRWDEDLGDYVAVEERTIVLPADHFVLAGHGYGDPTIVSAETFNAGHKALPVAPAADFDAGEEDDDFDGDFDEDEDHDDPYGALNWQQFLIVEPNVRARRVEAGETVIINGEPVTLEHAMALVGGPDGSKRLEDVYRFGNEYKRALSDGRVICASGGSLAEQARAIKQFCRENGVGRDDPDILLHVDDVKELAYRAEYGNQAAAEENGGEQINTHARNDRLMADMVINHDGSQDVVDDETAARIASGEIEAPTDVPINRAAAEVVGVQARAVVADRPAPSEINTIISAFMAARGESAPHGRAIKTLGNYQQYEEIRVNGRGLFAVAEGTPLEEIRAFAIGRVDPEYGNSFVNWIETGELRHKNLPARIASMPGYNPSVDVYNQAGLGFMVVKDHIGTMVYAWPEERVPLPVPALGQGREDLNDDWERDEDDDHGWRPGF